MSTLLTGFLPAFLRRPRVNWIRWHIAGMYYSVIGLYAAFASEVMVRIPGVAFFEMVILATVVITFLGMWFYSKKLKKWLTR